MQLAQLIRNRTVLDKTQNGLARGCGTRGQDVGDLLQVGQTCFSHHRNQTSLSQFLRCCNISSVLSRASTSLRFYPPSIHASCGWRTGKGIAPLMTKRAAGLIAKCQKCPSRIRRIGPPPMSTLYRIMSAGVSFDVNETENYSS